MTLDLDHYAGLAISAGNGGSVAVLRDELLALVAELRAAREVVDAAWAHRLHFGACVDPQLHEALDAYEKLAEETK